MAISFHSLSSHKALFHLARQVTAAASRFLLNFASSASFDLFLSLLQNLFLQRTQFYIFFYNFFIKLSVD